MKKSLVVLSLAFGIMPTLFGVSARADVLKEIKKNSFLKVWLEPAYMPFELNNKRGEIVGFDPDLAALMVKDLGVKLELIKIDWDGIIPALLTDKCDIIMSGMTITEERSQKIDFSQPYMVIGQTVLLRKDLADKVKSYADLNSSKYKIASKLGTTGEIAAKKYLPKAHYSSFETEQEGVMEVVNGKADAFIYDSPYNAVAIGQRGEGKLVFLDKPFTEEPLGWGVRKGNPEFIKWLNGFLAKVKQDGTYETLYRKWFKNTDWLKDVQ